MANLQNSTPAETPLKVNVKLNKDDCNLLLDPTLYWRLVGSLVYLTITRLGISYAVNLMSQFMSAPHHLRLAAICRIIRYLLGTPTLGLYFPTTTHSLSQHTPILICPGVLILATVQLAGACFSVMPWFPGSAKNKNVYLNLPQRLSFVQCPQLILKYCGSVVFCPILALPKIFQHHSMPTILVQF